MSLRNMTFNSIVTSSVSVFRLLSQFFVLPFLARYLSPEDYGVVALAMPFILFSILFSRSGIGSSLLREKEKDSDIWSTSFWFVCASGLFFTLLISGISPIAAWFFDTPRLMPILIWMSLGILLLAISIIPMTSLRHDKRFTILSITQGISIALGMIAAVIVAAKGGGAWALVVQGLVMHLSLAIMVFPASGFWPRFVLKVSLIKEHLSFGYAVIGASFIDFIRDSSRSFIIAKILGTGLLGFYSLTFMFLNLPYRIICNVLEDVIYTYLVGFRDDKPLLGKMLFFLTRILSILVFPTMGMIAVAHEAVFPLVLSEKWALSGTLFMFGAPAFALYAVSSVRIVFMQIIGKVRTNVRCNIELLTLEAIILLTLVGYGIEWAVIGLSLAVLFYQPRNLYVLLTNLGCSPLPYLRTLIPATTCTLVGVLSYQEFIHINPEMSRLAQMAIAICIGILALISSAGFQFKALRAEATHLHVLLGHKSR